MPKVKKTSISCLVPHVAYVRPTSGLFFGPGALRARPKPPLPRRGAVPLRRRGRGRRALRRGDAGGARGPSAHRGLGTDLGGDPRRPAKGRPARRGRATAAWATQRGRGVARIRRSGSGKVGVFFFAACSTCVGQKQGSHVDRVGVRCACWQIIVWKNTFLGAKQFKKRTT